MLKNVLAVALLFFVSQSLLARELRIEEEIGVDVFKALIEDKNIDSLEFPALASREIANTRKGSRVYFLFGYLETQFTNYEYAHALNAIRALQQAGWTVAADGSTSKREFQDYVSHSELAAIFWSSHGTRDGYVTVLNSSGRVETVTPSELSNPSSNLQLVIVCACYSMVAGKQYASQMNNAAYYGYAGLTTPQSCAAVLQHQFIPLFNKHVH